MLSQLFVSALYLFHLVDASISLNFYNFLKERRGKAFAESVARYDFGVFGSFGGGNHKGGQKTKRRPTIFVHGWNLNSFSAAYQPLSTFWLLRGYTSEELYGSTYGGAYLPGGLGFIESYQWSLKCQYIKTIRNLIIGVSEYTNSTVNVVSYSMGGPISRKAILGGKCVDTGEYLGPPLTNTVDTYLGVAGAMRGAMMCLADMGVCNHVDGMSCNSAFMKDINSVKRYEAHRKIYAMQSVTDEVVGYWACNSHPSEVPGADKTVTLFGYLHLGIIYLTGPMQFNLVSRNEVVVPKGEKVVIS